MYQIALSLGSGPITGVKSRQLCPHQHFNLSLRFCLCVDFFRGSRLDAKRVPINSNVSQRDQCSGSTPEGGAMLRAISQYRSQSRDRASPSDKLPLARHHQSVARVALPQAMSPAPAAPPIQCPAGAIFSTKMKRARPEIHARFMTPPTNSNSQGSSRHGAVPSRGRPADETYFRSLLQRGESVTGEAILLYRVAGDQFDHRVSAGVRGRDSTVVTKSVTPFGAGLIDPLNPQYRPEPNHARQPTAPIVMLKNSLAVLPMH